jgi:hypothetical protein
MPYNVSGLIRAKVYNEDGSHFANADGYFFTMDETGVFWEMISNDLENHVAKYFPVREHDKNTWQTGFGGDEGNGLIDFALQTNPPMIPDLEFTINGTHYTMKFGTPDIS